MPFCFPCLEPCQQGHDSNKEKRTLVEDEFLLGNYMYLLPCNM